jgi:outer membrane receptor protein involved in Fe transport
VVGGNFNSTTAAERRGFAASLRNAETTVLQRNGDIPANFSADLSAGSTFDVGSGRIGLIAAAGYSSTWRTRDALQQTSTDPELAGTPLTSFRRVTTDNRVIVNGLLGVGAEFGEHELRWTNLYIRDTLKQGRLAAGFNRNVADQDEALPPSLIEQNTYWFERQLIDTQLVGEFKFDDLSVDVRGTYANTQRESPYERDIGYSYLGDNNPRTKTASDVDDYVNNLTSPGQYAFVAFSDLNEDIYAGAIDFAYRIRSALPVTLSAGYAYTDNRRTSERYQFQYFRPEGPLPVGPAQSRPDFLLSDIYIDAYNIQLRDVSGQEGAAAYEADLRVHAGYAQAEVEHAGSGLRAQFGVRYEDALQTVLPVGAGLEGTRLSKTYWLPAATVTWNFAENMQLRAHASKTIARPQFRELAPQIFQDFESDREFTGNPFLTDSQLFNAEARYEWYFARGQRLQPCRLLQEDRQADRSRRPFSRAARISCGSDSPTLRRRRSMAQRLRSRPFTRSPGMADFLSTKRLLFIGNYTYSKSKLRVDDSIIVGPGLQPIAANLLFRDGAPLNGQSDHLANLQIGLEDTDRLSQATLLLTYASERVTNRGPIQGQLRQPDIIEKPGFRLDFVAREEIPLFGTTAELKFEARNILGQDYEEFQKSGDNRIDVNSYDVGRTFSMGLSVKF